MEQVQALSDQKAKLLQKTFKPDEREAGTY